MVPHSSRAIRHPSPRLKTSRNPKESYRKRVYTSVMVKQQKEIFQFYSIFEETWTLDLSVDGKTRYSYNLINFTADTRAFIGVWIFTDSSGFPNEHYKTFATFKTLAIRWARNHLVIFCSHFYPCKLSKIEKVQKYKYEWNLAHWLNNLTIPERSFYFLYV